MKKRNLKIAKLILSKEMISELTSQQIKGGLSVTCNLSVAPGVTTCDFRCSITCGGASGCDPCNPISVVGC